MIRRLFFVPALLGAVELFGMESQTFRLNTYRRGETILGEEFLAANEQVVDYLATLRHPSGPLEVVKFNCVGKTRLIEPSVRHLGSPSSNSDYVEARMVYDIHDCAELQ